jgi:hypothetical protein
MSRSDLKHLNINGKSPNSGFCLLKTATEALHPAKRYESL